MTERSEDEPSNAKFAMALRESLAEGLVAGGISTEGNPAVRDASHIIGWLIMEGYTVARPSTQDEERYVLNPNRCPLCGWGTTSHGGRAGVIVCPNCGWDSEAPQNARRST